jgi:hypothetical protein
MSRGRALRVRVEGLLFEGRIGTRLIRRVVERWAAPATRERRRATAAGGGVTVSGHSLASYHGQAHAGRAAGVNGDHIGESGPSMGAPVSGAQNAFCRISIGARLAYWCCLLRGDQG